MAATEDSGQAAPSQPILASYLLVLPEPLPINHLNSWTRRLDEPEPLLAGREVKSYEDLPPFPSEDKGLNFVSLRFWQVRDDQAEVPEAVHRSRLAARVAAALNPDAVKGDPDRILERRAGDPEPYRTVVQAVTFLAFPEDGVFPEGKPDPLTRCIDVLLGFHRAYRVTARKRVPELTYARLHSPVMWFSKPAFDLDARPEPSGLILLDHTNFPVGDTEALSSEAIEVLSQYNVRAAAGDPFDIYAERRLEAEVELVTNGRPRESVVQAGMAAEVLLGAVLGLAMWEEYLAGALSVEQAADALSTDLTPRIKSQYEKRFGGKWQLSVDPMRRWDIDIAEPRNRAVHAGVAPSAEQAGAALDTLIALERFLGDRLAVKWKTYPRTAWLFLGTDGLNKRGKKKLQAAEEWRQSVGSHASDWLRDYQQWRTLVDPLISRRRRS